MPQQTPDFGHDVTSIREWLTKEPHLPQDFSDLMIRKFLHSCYGSLERTKKCIDRFCTTRGVMSEIYTDRDPCSNKLKSAFDITTVATFMAGDQEILIHQLDDPTLERFVFYDLIKAFSLQADFWINDLENYPEGHIIIMDIKDYSLRMLPKCNIMFFRDFLLFLLEAMPVRVKSVNVINYPSYYEKLFALVKPVLPAYIIDVIKFHPDQSSLHKSISKQYLPSEYGGEAGSMRAQHCDFVKNIQDKRDYYKNDNLWKADLKKKPKGIESAMTGSFKTLSID
ncbi:alpha-tocopherol transfer protein-like [Cydia pomonella]|uniref:alpha-tocopherol transfer protein-like n=1 Tax=Cydia pomonella TaxID=82600 RepID=UPI002ADE57BD|nr:alpha-tocopherol transfer protein-like [Cydia pomonella]